ncbi:MAG: hypothetical protein FJZ47_09585 [Candidatus Tectomicrobia bacterium]|uniref:Uncharacterized protein n=1 Tax=Tectimicrobiota bacterium TaxID=2528274 RepID=A0A938B2I2_UNCTE|nr:hypothetical protein [Candidatus Tectomicrobia bacterium]
MPARVVNQQPRRVIVRQRYCERVAISNTVVKLPLAQLANVRDLTEQILLRWAGTSDVAPDSRGPNVDGQHLAPLEAFAGTAFNVRGVTNPTPQSAPNLTRAWEALVSGVQARLLLGGPLQTAFTSVVYDEPADRFVTLGTLTISSPVSKAANPREIHWWWVNTGPPSSRSSRDWPMMQG